MIEGLLDGFQAMTHGSAQGKASSPHIASVHHAIVQLPDISALSD